MRKKFIRSRLLSGMICAIMVIGVLASGMGNVNAGNDPDSVKMTAFLNDTETNPFADTDKAYSAALSSSVSGDAGTYLYSADNETQEMTVLNSNLNRYILQFLPECPLEKIYDLVKDYPFEVIGDSSNRIFSIESPEEPDVIQSAFIEYCVYVEEEIELFTEDVSTEVSVSEDVPEISVLSMPNDEFVDLQWHLEYLGIEAAWDYSTGSADVLVAVIDTGVSRTHPDLVNSDIRNGYDFVRDQSVLKDYAGHGTSVTGVIAATMNNNIGVTGISPHVAVMPLCVADNNGDLSTTAVTEAIIFAADSGCEVINLSLGGDYSAAVANAISYAYNKGCIIIAGAGNDGDSSYFYPASCDGVISVGSINVSSVKSDFSNYNNKIDVVAPGEWIATTADSSYTGYEYGYCDGTSFSSPCVAAVAALVVSTYPGMTPLEFEELVKATCIDLNTSGYDNYTGYGCVNALGILQSYNPERVSYQTHVQDIGWQNYVSNGLTSGTSGESKRLEAIRIKLQNIPGGIEYRTHVQDIGWQGWVSNDALSGTSGQSKRLEAIEIRLTGEAATLYDLYYRVHAQNTGWMDWAKNGQSSGTAGYSYRLEAIQIRLVPKGGPAPGPTTRPYIDGTTMAKVCYKTHVQDIGWQDYVINGAVSGTSGQSKRLEAIQINLANVTGGIEYRTHVQDIGWMDWTSNDALSGTSGQSKRLEAIEIRLTGEAATKYDVYYRVHAQNTGWLDWAKNGASAGTAGFSYRLEAIQIILVAKAGPAPGATARPFVQG